MAERRANATFSIEHEKFIIQQFFINGSGDQKPSQTAIKSEFTKKFRAVSNRRWL